MTHTRTRYNALGLNDHSGDYADGDAGVADGDYHGDVFSMFRHVR